jgi:hypothetical protein
MQYFIYLSFLCALLLDFLSRYQLIPHQATWAPEILSMVAAILVVFEIIRKKNLCIGVGYLIVFGLLGLDLLSGVLLNHVPLLVQVSGIRIYLKYLPFFFIPLVYPFSDVDIRKQLYLLLSLALFQVPVSLYQRFVQSSGLVTGDYVRGTLGTSSQLSIFLICVFSILFGFFLKKKLSLRQFLLLTLLVLFPTTVNETKGTVLLLPLAVLLPAFFNESGRKRYSQLFGATVIGVVVLAGFSQMYDYFFPSRHELVEFYTSEQLVKNLAPNLSGLQEDSEGRVDVLVMPFRVLSSDPFKLAYGLGIGNVGESFLGESFSGEYSREYGDKMYLAFAQLTWETGLFGILFVLVLFLKIFLDAVALRHHESLVGVLALGWLGVLGVIFISLFYKNIISVNGISYLFWYFSGYIAAMKWRSMRGNR